MNTKTLTRLKDEQFGAVGTPLRDEYEAEAQAFILGELIRAERQKANLTQEQLAERIGTKKSYISRIENGKGEVNWQTLVRIAEKGLGKRVAISFR
jgi:ribosome-binding protein aMBF1 (putative translation factor)